MDSRARILERENGDLLLEREAAERSNERTTSHLRKQLESLRKDVNILRSERDDELSQRHLLEAKCDNLEQQTNWTTSERDESIRAMEEARERLEECKQELQTALAFRSENDHLRLQLEFLQKDNRDLEAEREDLKEEFAKRLARLQRVPPTSCSYVQALLTFRDFGVRLRPRVVETPPLPWLRVEMDIMEEKGRCLKTSGVVRATFTFLEWGTA